ncbi:MAG: hypothetical protein ACREOD_07660 [Candidatus Dormibacteria bacterium]
MVADLAPAATRGRYMAAFNLSWSAGLLIGPAVGGLVVGSSLRPGMWLLWAAAATALVAYAGWLGLRLPRRSITLLPRAELPPYLTVAPFVSDLA